MTPSRARGRVAPNNRRLAPNKLSAKDNDLPTVTAKIINTMRTGPPPRRAGAARSTGQTRTRAVPVRNVSASTNASNRSSNLLQSGILSSNEIRDLDRRLSGHHQSC